MVTHFKNLLSAILICGSFSILSVLAQPSVVGDHPINIKLKPLPADQVVKLISERSKAVQAETGWDVIGAEQLQHIIIDVDFEQVPVRQVLTEILGCSGFDFTEIGRRIEIKPRNHVFPPQQCIHVLVNPTLTDSPPITTKQTLYSYEFEAISAADFIRQFSLDAGLNIVMADSKMNLQKQQLKISIESLPESVVMRKFFHCLGWEYHMVDNRVRAKYQGRSITTDPCTEFQLIP